MHQHDLLGDNLALLDSAEAEYATSARVGLLVTVGNTHTATGSDVEASELAILVSDRNKADVIGEDVDIVVRWDRNCDLELRTG